jgi:hypothetical protein
MTHLKQFLILFVSIGAFVLLSQVNPPQGGGTCSALGGDVTGTCAASVVAKVNGVVVANVVNATAPGAGLARFAGGTQTATSAELSGDVTTSGSNATTVVRVNGTNPNAVTPALVFGTSNGTGASATPFSSNASVALFNATIAGVTTPLALGTTGSAAFAARQDHTHQSPGGCASITSATGAISNTETQVAVCSMPANFMQAGTTFHIHAGGNITTSTTPGNDTFRIRIGTTTLTGNVPVSVAVPVNASVTTQPFTLDAWVTVRTAGAGGTAIGDIQAFDGGSLTTGAFTLADNGAVSTATVVVDTTATKLIEFTFISGASTSSATFQTAVITVVKM